MPRLASSSVTAAVASARRGLARVAAVPRVHGALSLVQREATRALFPDEDYDGRYYGVGRDPDDRSGLSGYERYDRATSNADAAAWLVWRSFPSGDHLDVGCATGFVVEALADVGIRAWGTDLSAWAIGHATAGAQGRLRQGDLTKRLPFRSGIFDTVTAYETLEHLPPDLVPRALAELRRVTRSYLIASIPSFGPRDSGQDGWLHGKVAFDRLAHYEALGPGYDGPVPNVDLLRDVEGRPQEGHLTIASFAWWHVRFADAGFVRMPDVERTLYRDLERFALQDAWNLYVFRTPSAPEPPEPVRTDDERQIRARAWGLDQRTPAPPPP